MKPLIILLVGIVVGYWLARKKGMGSDRSEEKVNNKKKILEMFQGEAEITNDKVQNALGVSDATATRYLDELEKEGKVTQHGTTGHEVYYTRR